MVVETGMPNGAVDGEHTDVSFVEISEMFAECGTNISLGRCHLVKFDHQVTTTQIMEHETSATCCQSN